MEMQRLTVHCYAEDAKEERRVTLSPMNVTLIAAEIDDVVVNNRSVRKVSVLFTDGGSVDLIVNHSDLSLLESAIGSFCLSLD